MTEFAAEPLFFIGKFPFTNTLLHTLIVDGILLGGTYVITKQIRLVPQAAQNAAEMLVSTFYDLTESIAESKASIIFPYFITFFLFIFVANITSLFPGFGTIGFYEGQEKFVPLFRGTTSDFNTTLGLALVSAFATHMLSIKTLGITQYLGRYFSLNPINLFIGLLEIISEITKVVSLSFRLFGNIFAGEVVLATVSGMFAFILPLPFIGLEIIVAFVQALVFSMLTMTFMAILTTSHNGH